MDFSVNKKCPFVWLFSLCIILSLPVHAGSPVWEVEKNGNKIFLGGTFHILTPEDYPLPAAFEDAYSQSTQIVFETDMVKLQSPGFQRVMLRQLTYSDGRNLQQVVSNSTYLALEEFFTARGIPMASIVNFKPGMVVTMMTIVELHRLGLVGVGVDAYFNEKAVNDRKTLGQLETVEEQLEFISNMGIGKEDEMLAYNLTDIEKLPSLWQLLKTAWRNGDMSKLNETIAIPLKNDFPELYQSILIGRNNAWLPQITAFFKTKELEFVLVGALHLAGEDGLLSKLSAQGYKIRQLP
jgi:uncharacterized protein YbaP (TraB family)